MIDFLQAISIAMIVAGICGTLYSGYCLRLIFQELTRPEPKISPFDIEQDLNYGRK